MNKKILVVSLLAVFTLVAISLVSAVSTNTVKPVERKDSPLFGIRTRRAIGDRLKDLRESIKTRFIGERLFFLPFQFLFRQNGLLIRQQLGDKTEETMRYTVCRTIAYTCCGQCVTVGCRLNNNFPVRNRLARKTCEVDTFYGHFTCIPYYCLTMTPTFGCEPCTERI